MARCDFVRRAELTFRQKKKAKEKRSVMGGVRATKKEKREVKTFISVDVSCKIWVW